MAAAFLRGFCEEALCSVCLEYFKDPVITECGHNFCRACLTQCWEGSEEKEVSCPQCRENIRRNLISNRQLANFVELTKQLRLQGESIPTEGKRGVCGKHQEPLKLFCKEDEAPICVVCDRSKEHRDHDVVPLEEAAQDYKDIIYIRLELLEQERAQFLACKAGAAEESQELLKQTKAEMEKTKEMFRELSSFLNEQEKLRLAQLGEVEKEIARKRDEYLGRLSEELSSLGGLIQEMEEKCQQPPSELVQDIRTVLQRCEEKRILPHPKAVYCELKLKFRNVCDQNNSLDAVMKYTRDALLHGSQLQQADVPAEWATENPGLLLAEDRKSVRNDGTLQDLARHPQTPGMSITLGPLFPVKGACVQAHRLSLSQGLFFPAQRSSYAAGEVNTVPPSVQFADPVVHFW
ncbi:hypothetical protein JRQ81_012386 [Phrynocephalus forsythii]|uniref:RING-type E3 ubiquitin transferase n=1 Tax=Phrynocephalus forsythii TaxID=171643 RepID=A0A9Q0X690_9SAUR|nr:hypothetical protein JRQ81_012386 [Phrynocephalus forsythii]